MDDSSAHFPRRNISSGSNTRPASDCRPDGPRSHVYTGSRIDELCSKSRSESWAARCPLTNCDADCIRSCGVTKHRRSQGPRILGAGSIALISLAAVLTLRGMPSVAEYGWSSIAFYLLGSLFFFIPLALVAAELATGWPRAGGLYAWVKQAFGDRSGFLAVWFEWIENIVWFPTVLSFVAATLAYVIDPSLANNKAYLVIAMLTIFWALTLANFFGMKWTARLNNPGVIAGTLLPALVLIVLGVYWLVAGRHIAIPFHTSKLVPNMGSLNNVVFFAGVLLGFAGIEMAGFHAKETRNPGRDYPRAIFLAAALIVGISILATLAIAFVVPQAKLSLVSGLLQAFTCVLPLARDRQLGGQGDGGADRPRDARADQHLAARSGEGPVRVGEDRRPAPGAALRQ